VSGVSSGLVSEAEVFCVGAVLMDAPLPEKDVSVLPFRMKRYCFKHESPLKTVELLSVGASSASGESSESREKECECASESESESERVSSYATKEELKAILDLFQHSFDKALALIEKLTGRAHSMEEDIAFCKDSITILVDRVNDVEFGLGEEPKLVVGPRAPEASLRCPKGRSKSRRELQKTHKFLSQKCGIDVKPSMSNGPCSGNMSVGEGRRANEPEPSQDVNLLHEVVHHTSENASGASTRLGTSMLSSDIMYDTDDELTFASFDDSRAFRELS